MSDQKNFLYAVVLSFVIFFTWDNFFGVKKTKDYSPKQQQQKDVIRTSPKNEDEKVVQHNEPKNREDALKGQRIPIKTETLSGSINLNGGILDDLFLLKYKDSIKEDANNISILNPQKTKDFYYVDFGFITEEHIEKPTIQTQWSVDNLSASLTPDTPISLYFENNQGIRFERLYSIDKSYMMTIKQRIINNSKASFSVQGKANIKRLKPDLKDTSYILHEGALGFLDNHLVEYDYDKLSEKTREEIPSKGGWIGFSDKYWLVALLANPDSQNTFSFQSLGQDNYQTGIKLDKKSINPGEAVEQSTFLYVGPKKLNILDNYELSHNIKNFDLAIDFGWFYFLTKPLFQFLDWLNGIVGNFGIAILIMTLLSKIILFPLANKSYYSMGKMKKIAPKMEEVKKRYEKDPAKMQQEIMALYKREKVNPLSGCLPMLIQAPIFFCLYKVLYISIEMRHAPFYGWIKDLSAKDPTSLFNLFGLIPWSTPEFLTIGLWPLIMGGTMVWQQKLNPQPVDPAQAKMMLFMPLFFTFIFSSFPAGLVIYWTFSNILSIAQQQVIMNISSKKQA